VSASMPDGLDEIFDIRTKAWWGFDHAPRGSCTPGCRLYGRCHCGCGGSPTISVATVTREGRIKGRPFAFMRGHQARVLLRGGGHWSRRGIPVEKVRPLLAWLHDRHGTWGAVAVLLRIPMSTVKGYANNGCRRRVPPEAAKRISELVLAHRTRGTTLDRWEAEPGVRPRPVIPSLLPPPRRGAKKSSVTSGLVVWLGG
jgi:hypothetical protein